MVLVNKDIQITDFLKKNELCCYRTDTFFLKEENIVLWETRFEAYVSLVL